jgi:hypothetical protein
MNYNKKKKEAKIETAEMKIFISVAAYTRKDQIRNTKVREELDILNLNNKILKSKSHCCTSASCCTSLYSVPVSPSLVQRIFKIKNL